jgi:predicted  nucleic acid-binding Zn-ribbon protein
VSILKCHKCGSIYHGADQSCPECGCTAFILPAERQVKDNSFADEVLADSVWTYRDHSAHLGYDPAEH